MAGENQHDCSQSDKLKDLEVQMRAGELRFVSIENGQVQILAETKHASETIKKIHAKLFIDNGSPSFQTRLDRHDTLMKFVVKSVVVISTATTGIAVTLIVQAVLHAAGGG